MLQSHLRYWLFCFRSVFVLLFYVLGQWILSCGLGPHFVLKAPKSIPFSRAFSNATVRFSFERLVCYHVVSGREYQSTLLRHVFRLRQVWCLFAGLLLSLVLGCALRGFENSIYSAEGEEPHLSTLAAIKTEKFTIRWVSTTVYKRTFSYCGMRFVLYLEETVCGYFHLSASWV